MWDTTVAEVSAKLLECKDSSVFEYLPIPKEFHLYKSLDEVALML